MGNRRRYRKAAELYVTGRTLELRDGSVLWCQTLNDFEISDARRQAAATRARYQLAMREVGSHDYDTLRSAFDERGHGKVIADIMSVRQPDHLVLATNELETDDEWKERYEILNRSEEISTRDDDDSEKILLNKINEEWVGEVNKIVNLEQERLERQLKPLTDDELFIEYRDEWVERRAGGLALDAYNVRELFHGARCCEALREEDGSFGSEAHRQCNHAERAFEDEAEIRDLPGELFNEIRGVFDDMALTVRDAKN